MKEGYEGSMTSGSMERSSIEKGYGFSFGAGGRKDSDSMETDMNSDTDIEKGGFDSDAEELELDIDIATARQPSSEAAHANGWMGRDVRVEVEDSAIPGWEPDLRETETETEVEVEVGTPVKGERSRRE